jgi:ATP-dependent protease ClpP protease subunit
LQQGGSLRKQLRLCHCGWGGIALPHATNHMHPTTSGSQGYTEDVRIAFREQERLQTQLFQRLGQLSGYTWQEIEEHFTHDRFMNALDAKAFGLLTISCVTFATSSLGRRAVKCNWQIHCWTYYRRVIR